MHADVQSPSTTHSKHTNVFVLISLLDLLWPLWVLVAHEVQGVPEIASYVNESYKNNLCEHACWLFM